MVNFRCSTVQHFISSATTHITKEFRTAACKYSKILNINMTFKYVPVSMHHAIKYTGTWN